MGTSFDVTAILKANVSDFARGMTEAKTSLESLRNQTGSSLEKISGSLTTMGAAMTGLGTTMTAGLTVPVAGAIGGVVKSFADLEQNLGGTQAVFGNFAKTIQTEAQTAYKNMGLSASDYMATANKMGSLFQGSGLDQQRALDLTSQAMQRAADVASVMGVDMKFAMESISGAAKGNFEMMDNLGVKMDATTLEAYALEKGLNFKWETASNAQKAELAMQMFMERTQQFDGNFLKESETSVAGSLDAMKGAFSNFVADLGNPEADMSQSMSNLGQTVKTFVAQVKEVIGTIWDNLPLAPWQKWLGLIAVAAGPLLMVFGTVFSVVGRFIGIISGVGKAFGALKAGFMAAQTGGTAVAGVFGKLGFLIGGITGPVWLVIAAIAALVAGFLILYNTNEDFRNKVHEVWASIQAAINTAVQAVVTFVQDIWGQMVAWWNENQELIRQTADTVWNAIKAVVETVMNALMPIIQTGWNLIVSVITAVWEVIKVVVETAINAVLGIIKAVMQMINGDWSGAWETLKGVANTIWEGIKSLIQVAIDGLLAIIQAGLDFIKSVWDTIWNTISTVVSTVWEAIKSAVSTAIEAVKTTVSNVMTAIKNKIEEVWNNIKSAVDKALSNIKSAAETAWNNIKSAISTAIDTIKSTVTSGWDNLVSTVTNAGPRIVSAVRNGFNEAVNAAKNFVSSAISAGSDLIGGFVQGVTNAAGRLIDAVGGAVQGAIDWAKGLLGIHSPSRVFRQFGLYTDEGFVIGIKTGAGKVVKSMAGMAQGAIAAFAGQDVAGSLQSELGAVDGELGRLTAYDPSVSFQGGSLTLSQQPADIVLKMGNTVYRAFAADITNAQELDLLLDHY